MMGVPSPHGLPSSSRRAWEHWMVATGSSKRESLHVPVIFKYLHFTFAALLLARGSHVAKFRVTVGGLYHRGSYRKGNYFSHFTMTVSQPGKLLPWLLVGGKIWKGSVLLSLPVSMFLDFGEFIPWWLHQPAFQWGPCSAPLKPGSLIQVPQHMLPWVT